MQQLNFVEPINQPPFFLKFTDYNHLAFILKISENELSAIISEPGRFYYRTVRPKMKYGLPQRDQFNNIKLRELCPSIGLLKIIQKKIYSSILQKIKIQNYAYGSLKGKNNILNAICHIESTYFLTVDLKNFFSLINHHQVYKMFIKILQDKNIAGMLTKLTTVEKKLPQGTSTSPSIANLVFMETGNVLWNFCKQYNLIFTAYLDDLTFSSKDDFFLLIPELLKIIRQGGFYPNKEKIKYSKFSTEVTGLIIKEGQLTLIDDMERLVDRNLHLKLYQDNVRRHVYNYYLHKT